MMVEMESRNQDEVEFVGYLNTEEGKRRFPHGRYPGKDNWQRRQRPYEEIRREVTEPGMATAPAARFNARTGPLVDEVIAAARKAVRPCDDPIQNLDDLTREACGDCPPCRFDAALAKLDEEANR